MLKTSVDFEREGHIVAISTTMVLCGLSPGNRQLFLVQYVINNT